MKDFYDHAAIESKWADYWQRHRTAKADLSSPTKKFYCLDMFPYPSGEGLHVGHWRGYVLSDFYARVNKIQGQNVFHPMGFDAFGLPAENAAIKHKSHPRQFTEKAITTFKHQLRQLGAMYDWSAEVNTSDPSYYKWTQWLFLQFYKHGLAQKRLALVNWCPKDQTVLANEQVVDGRCERCGSQITKKELSQWYLLITKFADELLEGLDGLDWPENVKELQRNWIGRSEGLAVTFATEKSALEVFTTRPETIYGVNAIVLAPEHPSVIKLISPSVKKQVLEYIEQSRTKSELDRQKDDTDSKSGCFIGTFAKHPLTGDRLPIWVADYVLPDYGKGAIMSVPAHDQRDYSFSRTNNLPVTEVIKSSGQMPPHHGPGKMINSAEFNGLDSQIAKAQIAEKLIKSGLAKNEVSYRIRDWLVSRQRYWGAPIPIVYDRVGAAKPIKEKHLPLLLPDDVDFLPGGISPLARSQRYKDLAENLYGEGSRFDSDTLDTFVDSSWYYLRYLSADRHDIPFDKKKVSQWMPVDLYVGGIEHAVLHLLYARFVYRFLIKFGYLGSRLKEPFKRLFNIGMVTKNGAKMSKSKGNVVSADFLVESWGADTVRGYELFIGPMDEAAEWQTNGLNGIHRFLIKLHKLTPLVREKEIAHQRQMFDGYLDKISVMLKAFRLNTYLAEAMKLVNSLQTESEIDRNVYSNLIITLSPACPHLAEELWEQLGNDRSIFANNNWPRPFGQAAKPALKILLNQKFIGSLEGSFTEDNQALEAALRHPKLVGKIKPSQIAKTIFKTDKIINIITK